MKKLFQINAPDCKVQSLYLPTLSCSQRKCMKMIEHNNVYVSNNYFHYLNTASNRPDTTNNYELRKTHYLLLHSLSYFIKEITKTLTKGSFSTTC